MSRPRICKHDRLGRSCHECDMEEEFGALKEQLTSIRACVESIRDQFEREWTYELGTGEVVDEILSRLDEILNKEDAV